MSQYRTEDELRGAVTALQMAAASKEVQVWLTELRRYKDIQASKLALAKTSDEAFKGIGVLHGLDIALELDKVLGANLSQKIVRP